MASANDYHLGKDEMQALQVIAEVLDRPGIELAKSINAAGKRTSAYEDRHQGEAPAPRPVRFVDIGRETLLKEVLHAYYPAYSKAMASGLPIVESLNEAVANRQMPASLARTLTYPESSSSEGIALTACGMGGSNLIESRFAHRQGVVIDVAPELHELLGQTDVRDDLPWSQLRLPYPAIYVHLPPQTHAGLIKISSEDGSMSDELIDGFYAYEDVATEGRRAFTVMLMQNMAGRHAPASDSLLGFVINDEEHSIQGCVDSYLREYSAEQTEDGRWLESAKSVFLYLTKVVLYMSLPDRCALFIKERSEADKKARSTPAGIMRKKREEKAERLYDRIVIGQGIEHATDHESTRGSGQRATHWRRGHFRGQRVGPGRTGIKTVWIRPMLIGLKHAEQTPTRKDYILKL